MKFVALKSIRENNLAVLSIGTTPTIAACGIAAVTNFRLSTGLALGFATCCLKPFFLASFELGPDRIFLY